MQRLWLFENKLSRLEGLSECGELRELCVQSNRIERIGSALNSTVHLESLALADNKVSSYFFSIRQRTTTPMCIIIVLISSATCLLVWLVSSFSSCTSASCCAYQLSDFHELSRLKHLPLLKEVSLRDLHFGACPVTQLDGYRNAVLISLPQLMVLDGIEVCVSMVQHMCVCLHGHLVAPGATAKSF